MLYKIVIATLMIFGINGNLYADVVSLESNYVAGEADLVGHLNRDRTSIVNGINNARGVFAGGAQSSGQIKTDTIGEENMADDANPRIRTSEGASCADFVVSGLLPVTTTGTLTGSIPSGTAYPDGYRVNKSSATARTFTASRWTFIDLDINGTFQYSEVVIGSATPSVAANSARLARVSTNASEINNVQDLRTTSCTSGPLSSIKDSSTEASLNDMFSNGAWVRRYSPAGRTPAGWTQGLFVSWDTVTQFIVTPGSAYINGEYRFVSTNVTVTQANDAPLSGDSGLDTGNIAASTRYYVYAVADKSGASDFSVTYSTNSTTPSGLTNYRLIGSIVTDATSFFTSRDIITVHGISDRETIGGWILFDGTGTISIKNAFNVSSITDNGVGDYTITWDADFNNANYSAAGNAGGSSLANARLIIVSMAVGSANIQVTNTANTAVDHNIVTLMAIGDMRR